MPKKDAPRAPAKGKAADGDFPRVLTGFMMTIVGFLLSITGIGMIIGIPVFFVGMIIMGFFYIRLRREQRERGRRAAE